MKKLLVLCPFVLVLCAQQGWYPHEGGLMKYRVNIRFGEEPDTMRGRRKLLALGGEPRPTIHVVSAGV